MSIDIRQLFVMAAGFFVGAMVAYVAAPGNVAMWIATGVAAGLFAGAYFAETGGASAFWPLSDSSRRATAGTPASQTPTGQPGAGLSALTMATRSQNELRTTIRATSRGRHPQRKQDRRRANHLVCQRLPSKMPHRPVTN